MGLFDWLFGKRQSGHQDAARFLKSPKVSEQCIAALNKKNQGVVLIRESIVQKYVASKPGSAPERTAAIAAAQLGLLTCRGALSPQDLIQAAVSMTANAEVKHLQSATEAVDGLPSEWDVPVYQVMFG